MRWIVDDGPFDILATVRPAGLIRYPPGRMLIAPSTAADAARSQGRRWLLELETADGSQLLETFEILLGASDPAGAVFLDLHPDESVLLDRAENEAIAWALTHGLDAVFVTADRRAAVTALAEVGRNRVAHPFDLWIDLLEADVVTAPEFQNLCERTRQKDQGLRRMPSRTTRLFLPG